MGPADSTKGIKEMNYIYLVKRTVPAKVGDFTADVVVASSQSGARWMSHLSDIQHEITLLGEADSEVPTGLVLSSLHRD